MNVMNPFSGINLRNKRIQYISMSCYWFIQDLFHCVGKIIIFLSELKDYFFSNLPVWKVPFIILMSANIIYNIMIYS